MALPLGSSKTPPSLKQVISTANVYNYLAAKTLFCLFFFRCRKLILMSEEHTCLGNLAMCPFKL